MGLVVRGGSNRAHVIKVLARLGIDPRMLKKPNFVSTGIDSPALGDGRMSQSARGSPLTQSGERRRSSRELLAARWESIMGRGCIWNNTRNLQLGGWLGVEQVEYRCAMDAFIARTRSGFTAVLLILFGLVACAPSPGRFELRLDWGEDGPPPGENVHLFGRVVQAEVDSVGELVDASSLVLRTPVKQAGPVPLGSALEFTEVPNGTNYVIFVEARESSDPQSQLLRIGRSTPFDLQPGETTIVDLPIRPEPPPGQGGITVGTATTTEVFVNDPLVDLIVLTDAVLAEVSNLDSFPAGTEEVPMTVKYDLQASLDADCNPSADPRPVCRYLLEDWDLNLGLGDTCERANSCPRIVYIRFTDARGVRSNPVLQAITLDTMPPDIDLAATRVEPELATLDRPIAVAAVFTEQVVIGSVQLEVPDSAAEFVRTSTPVDPLEAANQVSLRLPAARALGPAGAYEIFATATDRAGNAASRMRVGTVELDTENPSLTLGAVDARTTVGRILRIPLEVGEIPKRLDVLLGRTRAECPEIVGPGQVVCTLELVAGTTSLDEEAPDQAERPLTLSAEVEDAAGNTTRVSTVVVIDRRGPGIIDASFAAPLVPAGRDAVLALTLSEPLDGAPELVFDDPDPALTLAGSDGQRYVFSRAVSSGSPADGTYRLLAVRSTDLLGNTRTSTLAVPAEVTVDATAPEVVDLTVVRPATPSADTPPRASAGTTIEATFSILNDVVLGEEVQVSVAGSTLACGLGPFPAGTTIRCTSAPLPQPTAAFTRAETLLVEVADQAGNSARASAPLIFDFEAPRLLAAGVSYQSASDNVLTQVDAAKVGTTVQLNILTSEEVMPFPATFSLSLDKPGLPAANLDFDLVAGSTTGFGALYQHTISSSIADADYVDAASVASACSGLLCGTMLSNLRLQDIARNESQPLDLVGAQIRIRTSRPDLVVAQDQVSYVRSPVGNGAPENLGSYTIPPGPFFALGPPDGLANTATLAADTFSLAGSRRIASIRIWSDSERRSLLQSARPLSDGTWDRRDLELLALDASQVFVTGVDRAGNESAAGTAIRDNWWVATSGPSPSSAEGSVVTIADRRVAPRAPAPGATQTPTAMASFDRGLALAQPALRWSGLPLPIPYAPGVSAAPTYEPLMGAYGYDSLRRRFVLVGSGWTTEWDGSSWQRLPLPVAHPRLYGATFNTRTWVAAAAYDSLRGRLVLLAGQYGAGRAETWEWDGENWFEVTPPSTSASPSSRTLHAMAFDPTRGRVVMFGGSDDSQQVLGDTWEWDGQEWSRILASGSPPSSRYGHTMAFDPSLEEVVLFGGMTSGATSAQTDTWTWDGTRWRRRAQASEANTLSHQIQRLFFDSEVQRVRLFIGGASASFWDWTGSAWVAGAPGSAVVPTTIGGLGLGYLVFDMVLRRPVFSNGYDTWEWNGSSWISRTPQIAPGDEQLVLSNGAQLLGAHALVYDAAQQASILLEGLNMWQLQQSTWVPVAFPQLPTTIFPPPLGYSEFAAFDPLRSRVLVTGGSHLAEFDGTQWHFPTVSPPSGVAPSPPAGLQDQSLAFDTGRGRLVLFGGQDDSTDKDEVWEWDGTWWISVPRSGASWPRARTRAKMVYDSARGRVVLLGGLASASPGAQYLDDVWAWDGRRWWPLPSMPAGRRDHSAVYDSRRDRIVVFGGADQAGESDEWWEFDGVEWSVVSNTRPRPIARLGHSMSYDPSRQGTLVFGGSGVNMGGIERETWMLQPEGRGTIKMDVSLPSSLSSSSLLGLTTRAACGAQYTAGGTLAEGAQLDMWASEGMRLPSGGGWVTQAVNSAGLSQAGGGAGTLTSVLTSSTTLARHLVSTGGATSLHVRCAPRGDSGGISAEVAADYMEVRIRYR